MYNSIWLKVWQKLSDVHARGTTPAKGTCLVKIAPYQEPSDLSGSASINITSEHDSISNAKRTILNVETAGDGPLSAITDALSASKEVLTSQYSPTSSLNADIRI